MISPSTICYALKMTHDFLKSEYFCNKTEYNRKCLEELSDAVDEIDNLKFEVEGFERVQWVKFDPSDESTYPPNKTHVLVYGLSDNMRDDEKLCGLDVDFWLNDHFVCYCNITHWRPLPPAPRKEEA